MERIGSRKTHDGVTISVRVDEIRYDDGETSEREVVEHPGAVAILAHDDETIFMVRQPREAVGEASLLELPAGKLDVEGESPLDCAKRELIEEVGLQAEEWREVKRMYTSPGFADEQQRQHRLGVMAEAGVALARVGSRKARGEQRWQAERERRVGVVESLHAAMPVAALRADDSGARTDDRRIPAKPSARVQSPDDAHRLALAAVGGRDSDVVAEQTALAQRRHVA